MFWLSLSRRPLSPGVYGVHAPEILAAIKDMKKRGQPCLGTFLLTDSDVITDLDSVHAVSIFAQITQRVTATGRGEDEAEVGLIALLYHNRCFQGQDRVPRTAANRVSAAIRVPKANCGAHTSGGR